MIPPFEGFKKTPSSSVGISMSLARPGEIVPVSSLRQIEASPLFPAGGAGVGVAAEASRIISTERENFISENHSSISRRGF